MGKVSELDTIGAGLYRGHNGEKLDTMMVVGTPPWHYSYNEDLVKVLEEGTKIRHTEINALAGLEWGVYQVPAQFTNRDGVVVTTGDKDKNGKIRPTHIINVRDDFDRAVGVVKSGYKVFQNTFAPEFLDSLVDTGDAFFETAGSLHGGSQVWWLMKIPNGVTVGGVPGEDLQSFILFSNSHDGSLSLTISIVTVRVVCQNTLSWALEGANRTMKVRHTKNAGIKIEEARKALELGFVYQQEMAVMGDKLINTSFSDKQFDDFLDSLLPLPEPDVEIDEDGVRTKNQFAITTATKQRDLVREVYETHPTQTPIKGTAWGAVQAVQFYSDHIAMTKTDDSRFIRLTRGNNLGSKAYKQVAALV